MSLFTLTAAPPGTTRRSPGQTVLCLLATLLLSSGIVGCENVSLGNSLPTLSDESPLSQSVVDALSRDPELRLFSISVKTLDGDTVRLSGTVDNDAQRVTAENVAAQVAGVRSVVNTLYLRN